MNMFEDFTRCECGEALVEKKVYYLTRRHQYGIEELADTKRVQYTCKSCKKLLFEASAPNNNPEEYIK